MEVSKPAGAWRYGSKKSAESATGPGFGSTLRATRNPVNRLRDSGACDDRSSRDHTDEVVTNDPPRITRARPRGGPAGSRTEAGLITGSNQSSHHSHTLPRMS